MLEKFIEFTRKNKDLAPDFKIISLTEKQNRFQYVGGQIKDGVLYGVVNSAEKMLKYNIKRNYGFFGTIRLCGF